ncbi:putative transcription factor interactor and regulator CCHC(Zn) family [Medicago truncatula]|uniref:Putative transcription factor interactor and regulator CCHC(Zn) family n=1 Tax=Medicago truncatula TaxID=3880 RepID=A0A396J988_MEDTR|nr:uncharacterized zinc finger CCHC domain-containing protein At4g19190 isoform X1 [Medicago truncatula]XP_039686424.1 uncharacterized zinc finger CCHC domain-containing protein At4g19190 isoform X1 [Medicago truncatula]RHN73574.1 putative transcription factor interactor and regulator CCHC(Zn) family [Medicago truncatula]
MEGEEGGGVRLSKRFNDDKGGGEVDYKTKSGTAWSHNFLNQKPWHPLSYPNQRRKWIAEQTHAQRERRTEEVAREYAQEQEFYRTTSLISKKDKEKVELMQAVSFMYVRPPGYNPESAKAAELNDEKKKEDTVNNEPTQTNPDGPSSLPPHGEKKKPRPKDVFGRALPTEEEFEVLKNAPRHETGVAARAKPFGVEIRNVKCLRCGNYGHQSGDRECPLKDAIMPNEENRLKRDDPLNAILAHTDLTEPLKWELKQKPGISPPRGGFKPDDPNQQIVAEEEDIFDEYGGFLNMGDIPDLLTNLSKKPKKSKNKKHKKQKLLHSEREASLDDGESRSKKKRVKESKKKRDYKESSSSGSFASEKVHGKSRNKHSDDFDSDRNDPSRKTKPERSLSLKDYDHPRHGRSKHGKRRHSFSSEESGPDCYNGNYKNRDRRSYSSEDPDSDRDDRGRKNIQKHKRKHGRKRHYNSDEKDSGPADYHLKQKGRDEHSYKSDDCNHQRQPEDKISSHKYSSIIHCDSQRHHVSFSHDRYRGSQKSRSEHSCSSNDSDVEKNDQSRRIKEERGSQKRREEHLYSSDDSDVVKNDRSRRICSSNDSDVEKNDQSRRIKEERGSQKRRAEHLYSSDDVVKNNRSRRIKEKHGNQKRRTEHSYSSDDSDEKNDRSRRIKEKYGSVKRRAEHSYSSDDSDVEKDNRSRRIKEKDGSVKRRAEHSYSSDDSDVEKDCRSRRIKEKHRSQKSRAERSYSSVDSDVEKDGRSRRIKEKHCGTPDGSEHAEIDVRQQNREKPSYHRSEKSYIHREKHKLRKSFHKH